MKSLRHVLLVSALTLLSCCGLIWSGGGAVDNCTENTTDDFDPETYGTTWQDGVGVTANCAWTIFAGGPNIDKLGQVAVYGSADTCNGLTTSTNNNYDHNNTDQWGCWLNTELNTTTANMDYPGIVFRAGSVTAAANFYQVYATHNSSTVTWLGEDLSTTIGTCDMGTNWGVHGSNRFCAKIEGTGTSTQLDIWYAPTGTDPDDWGASDCCINDGGTGGCNADVSDFTNTAIEDDAGDFMGIRGEYVVNGASTFPRQVFEDWQAGTCN